MQRPRLLAAVVAMLLVGSIFIVGVTGELPNEVYAGLGIDPPGRSEPTPRVTQPKCPSSGDIEWLLVSQFAEHFDRSPNSPEVREYVSQYSAIWRSVSLLCGKYRELGHTIVADFAERYASIGASGPAFRRGIWCRVEPTLTERERYFVDKSFDYIDWRLIRGDQGCNQT